MKMKPFTQCAAMTMISLALLAAAVSLANQAAIAQTPQTIPNAPTAAVIVLRGGSRPAQKGPTENFTGSVRVDPLFSAEGVSDADGASVTFEPGARTAWHSHPRGQTLIVTAGIGRVQNWGGTVLEIRPGDVVRIPAGVKHWHGAAPATAMTHIAIHERQGGQVVTWMEKVSEQQYQSATRNNAMSEIPTKSPSDAQKSFGDIAPALAQYTDEVLFGDVWKRPGLSPRDRSLITVATLVAGYRTNELPFHMKKALGNGVGKDELIELITHLAFYSGWPTANTALPIARRVFEEASSAPGK
jgi:4-carboxymuconolactone decarboxylase